MQQHMES